MCPLLLRAGKTIPRAGCREDVYKRQRSTILAHRDIYEAIAARSPSRARDAMNIHLAEALRKLRKSRLKEDDED